MKNFGLAVAVAGGLLIGTLGVHAKLPPAPPKSDAEKAAQAEKDAAAKAKETELNAKYVDKAVANYKKNKGIPDPAAQAPKAGRKQADR